MELLPGTNLHGFAITACEPLAEIDGMAIEARHERSGARLLFLRNDDNNKSFGIGFRTPPADDTGVFHILEHSVLCGSTRFPVKEPFVDLLKSSMQTFLNAMTFADKTLYPVASTNEQDLINLMDVYLDAVFHPNIYSKRAIFEQEGWHYELVANDADMQGANDPASLPADDTTLVYNGVVYNEMKGALSDATSVLYDALQAALFPDTCYAFESGGTPQAIPTLTYENYLDEHRRHYRTDNSYIILYGNIDANRVLGFLDERYLTPVASEQAERDAERARLGLEPLVPRTIDRQSPVAPGHTRRTMNTAPENACAACGFVVGESGDYVRSLGVDVLLDALFGSNEAPLKRVLLDAGIAHDVIAFVSDAVLQPFAVVQLQMPSEQGGCELASTLDRETRALLERGLDRDIVEAALSHAEFQLREHDMGIADGVMHAMTSLSTWLYDDDAATDYLRYEEAFATLREGLDNGFFEQLALELFCENDHQASVEVVPTPGESTDDVSAQLAAMNRDLDTTARERIVAEEAVLRELQEAPDSPEATATLPRLTLADIDTAPAEPTYAIDETAPLRCMRHSVATHGIAYAYRYFDLSMLAFEDLPYVSVLANVLGKLDTARHTAAQIDTLVQGKLGNLSFYSDVYENRSDIAQPLPMFVVSASALGDNAAWLAELPNEILLETDFSNAAKTLDALKQRKIGMEQAFTNSGHSCASARCKSYYTQSGVVREQLGNVGFYRFLCDLIEHYDERSDELASRLRDVCERLFCDDSCTLSFAGGDAEYERFWAAKPQLGRTTDGGRSLVIPDPVIRNEAFVVPSDVCYAATGWDRRLLSQSHTGTWAVVSRALSYDYLWNEVRVKGGAYGTGFQELRGGNMRFYSYRDPHLDETLARFARASEWLGSFDPAPEVLEGFIVATTAGYDAPVKPRALIRRQMGDFFTQHAPEERIAHRSEALATTSEDMRRLASVVERVVDQHAVCVFGNREIIENASVDLAVIPLIG